MLIDNGYGLFVSLLWISELFRNVYVFDYWDYNAPPENCNVFEEATLSAIGEI